LFDLGYRNHRMDDLSPTEIRARLIFLFRLLRVDTIFSYDPWGHYEENPDHYVTAQAVEAACWMSGGHLDMPEHFAAGLKPHSVSEKYYFARGPQLVNRVVDIGPTFETKTCLPEGLPNHGDASVRPESVHLLIDVRHHGSASPQASKFGFESRAISTTRFTNCGPLAK